MVYYNKFMQSEGMEEDKDYNKGYNPVSVNQAKENHKAAGRAFEHL